PRSPHDGSVHSVALRTRRRRGDGVVRYGARHALAPAAPDPLRGVRPPRLAGPRLSVQPERLAPSNDRSPRTSVWESRDKAGQQASSGICARSESALPITRTDETSAGGGLLPAARIRSHR